MRAILACCVGLSLAIAGCRHAAPGLDGDLDSDADVPIEDTGIPPPDNGLGGFDGGPSTGDGCPLDYSHCPQISDRTMLPSTAIGIQPGAVVYFPPCVRIVVGATVQIQATMAQPVFAAPCNPAIQPLPVAGATSSMGYRFTEPGRYGFYSPNDGTSDGSGMAGLIVVDPVP